MYSPSRSPLTPTSAFPSSPSRKSSIVITKHQSFLDFDDSPTSDMLLFPPPKSRVQQQQQRPRGRATTLPTHSQTSLLSPRPSTASSTASSSSSPAHFDVHRRPSIREGVIIEQEEEQEDEETSNPFQFHQDIASSSDHDSGKSGNSFDSVSIFDSTIYDLERRRNQMLQQQQQQQQNSFSSTSTSPQSNLTMTSRTSISSSHSNSPIGKSSTIISKPPSPPLSPEAQALKLARPPSLTAPISLPNIQAMILEDELSRRRRMKEQLHFRIDGQIDMHAHRRKMSLDGPEYDSVGTCDRILKYLGELGGIRENMGGQEIFTDSTIKYYHSSTSFLKNKTRLWKSRHLVITFLPSDDLSPSTRHLNSSPTQIVHLHIYKTESPSCTEVDRLQITPSSIICVTDEYPGSSTGSKGDRSAKIILKVTGLRWQKSGLEVSRKDEEWFFEMKDGQQVKEWLKRLKMAAREPESLIVGGGLMM